MPDTPRPLLGLSSPGRTLFLLAAAVLFGGVILAAWVCGAL